jgi:hypothetical protein
MPETSSIERRKVMHGIDMKVSCKTVDVLAMLRKNREGHAAVVKEARKGYIEQAQKVLTKKLRALQEGKLVSLQVALMPPRDYTKTYDTAIKMLEMHTGNNIKMTAMEVRQFIEDEWDWSTDFLMSNSMYSVSARRMSESRGYANEDPGDEEAREVS